MPARKKLTDRQSRFVEAYLLDPNKTAAARAAGYSAKTAAEQGSRLFRNVQVRRTIEEAQKKRADRLELTADAVLRELMLVAFADYRKAFDAEGRLLLPHEMPPELGAALAGIDVEQLFDGQGADKVHIGDVKKLKRWDKVKALELLGKNLKLFADRVEHTGKDGGPIEAKVTPAPFDLGKLTREQLVDLRRLIVAASADGGGDRSGAPAA